MKNDWFDEAQAEEFDEDERREAEERAQQEIARGEREYRRAVLGEEVGR